MRGTRKRALEILLVLGTVALLVSIVMQVLDRRRYTSSRVPCASQLRQLGQALLLFEQDHGGVYPNTLDELGSTASHPRAPTAT